jgi:hypothetical protein
MSETGKKFNHLFSYVLVRLHLHISTIIVHDCALEMWFPQITCTGSLKATHFLLYLEYRWISETLEFLLYLLTHSWINSILLYSDRKLFHSFSSQWKGDACIIHNTAYYFITENVKNRNKMFGALLTVSSVPLVLFLLPSKLIHYITTS